MNNYTTKTLERRTQLVGFARTVERAAMRGLFGIPMQLRSTTIVNGPRAGALEINAGFESGALLRSLQADDGATLRQLIPWPFIGEPCAFMSERCVRIEAGWPRDLADDDIPLAALGQHPTGGGRWLVGRNERGHVLTAGLSDATPHWLLSGTTGSGKTTALISMISQLSADTNNRLVLIDAKHGASLRNVSHVRGLVGPLADDVMTARAALAWCINEMSARYSGARDDRRLIVVIDEVQDIANDQLAAESLRRLVVQGRGAHVYAVIATQHPVVSALGGPTIGRNMVGRLALRVSDADASRVAIGASNPRADHLLGRGDAYAVAPGATHRIQVAYLDRETQPGEPEIAAWPEATSELPDNTGWPTGSETGVAILSAMRDEGRRVFQRICESEYGFKIADNNRANNLLKLARTTLEFMNDHDMAVCLSEKRPTPYRIAENGSILSVPGSPDRPGGENE